MLNEQKNIYLQSANLIKDWRKLSQMELINGYLEKGPLYQSYLSALIVKYWHIVDRNYYAKNSVQDITEIYNWYISAIMFAITNRPWENADSTIHNDPKAVEKVLNTFVKCTKANWYQASNRYKRKANHNIVTADYLTEDSDTNIIEEFANKNNNFSIEELIFDFCSQEDYITAFIIYIISTQNILLTDSNIIKFLCKELKTVNSSFVAAFCSECNLDITDISNSLTNIAFMDTNKLTSVVEIKIEKLRNYLASLT